MTLIEELQADEPKELASEINEAKKEFYWSDNKIWMEMLVK